MTSSMVSTAVTAIFALASTVFSLDVRAFAAGITQIQVDGVINAGTARYVARGIEVSEADASNLLIIRLNTPGGLLNSTREIVQKINQSKVPVAVWVAPSGASATSAGTIIAMSAKFAAMASGTNIGAAHPIGGQGEDIKGDAGAKAVNDTAAFIKAQALQHGRNAEWAEQAIRKSVSASADEAVKLKAVDFLADDRDELIMKIVGNAPALAIAGEPIRELPMTAAEKLLTFLGDPNVSYLLMALGGVGLYAELSAPGVGFPGIFGVICLILAFISFSTLPVNAGAAALLVLGLGLFVAELYVASYGVLTAGGIVSLVLGALFLMDPSTGDLRLSLALVLPTVAAVGLVGALVAWSLARSRRSAATFDRLGGFAGFEARVESVDGAGLSGKCMVRGELWDFEVDSSSDKASVADRLEVIERRGLTLIVRLQSRARGQLTHS